jgi:hypothetical protein
MMLSSKKPPNDRANQARRRPDLCLPFVADHVSGADHVFEGMERGYRWQAFGVQTAVNRVSIPGGAGALRVGPLEAASGTLRGPERYPRPLRWVSHLLRRLGVVRSRGIQAEARERNSYSTDTMS